MRLTISIILNIFAPPIGFLVLKDFKLFIYFLSFFLIFITFYLIVYVLAIFDSPTVILIFMVIYYIALYSICLYFTLRSYKTYNNRTKLNNYGFLKNLFLISSLIIIILIIEDYCIDFVRSNLISANNIINSSVEPSLQFGDYVFVKRSLYTIGRGELVSFTPRHELNDKSFEVVKRVIGMPGDKLNISKIKLKNDYEIYKIILNNKEINKEETDLFTDQNLIDVKLEGKHFYKETLGDKFYYTMYSSYLPDKNLNHYLDKEIVLNEDEYFVLGDNRSDSLDSLAYGPIKSKDISGKIFFKYLSINFKNKTCDDRKETQYYGEQICSSNWYSKFLRSKVRFSSIGERGYYFN